MNCKEAMHLLPAFMDGDLAEQRRRVVLDHVASCPECSEALAQLRILEDLLARRASDVPSHARLVEKVLLRTARRTRKGLRGTVLGYAGVPAATLLLILVLASTVGFRAFELMLDMMDPSPIVSLFGKLGVLLLEVASTAPLLVYALYLFIPLAVLSASLYFVFDFSRSK